MFYDGMLKYPPLKYPKKIDFVIKKTTRTASDGEAYNFYQAFNKKGENLGNILGRVEVLKPNDIPTFFPGLKTIKSFEIKHLRSFKHNFGNKLLDFIVNESRNLGCKGKFHTIASERYTEKTPSHIFFRKYGMNSLDTFMITNIDRYLKGKIPIEDLDTYDITMYYIPKKEKSAQNVGQSLLKKVLSIFS